MSDLHLNYSITSKNEQSLARTAIVKIGDKKFVTPFLWLGLSIIESTDFQYNIFMKNNVEGILINAYDLKFQDTKGLRKDLIEKLRKSNLLIKCDSGGFQQSKQEINMDQSEVYKIQSDVKADIAIQLDFPLKPGSSKIHNYKRIDKTIKNFEKLLEINKGTTILPTIHGYDEEMINYSLNKIMDILGGQEPAGIAIGSLVPFLFSMNDTGKIGGKKKALDLLIELRKKLPNSFIHVLGAGGTMSYLMHYIGVDSLDNSGWIKKAGFGAIQMPGISDRFIYHTEKRKSLDDDLHALDSWLECVCPACSSTLNRSKFYGKTEKARFLRAMHNVYVYQSEIIRLRKFIQEGRIREFVWKRLQNSIYRRLLEYVETKINPRNNRKLDEFL